MKIPIFKLDFDDDFIEKYKRGTVEILNSNKIQEGKWVSLFENKFSSLVNSKYAISTCNGTSALDIALRTINIKNKKVIMPSNTFFATPIACLNAGGIIELVDISTETMSIDPEKLKKSIIDNFSNENEIGAVIIVHIGGIISKDINEIVNLCKHYKIPLIEDAAHAHLSNFDNKYAGTIGDIGCFSFFPTKVMTSAAGGMITTNNLNLYLKAKSLKNFGRNINNEKICEDIGINSQVSEFTGLFGYLECDRVIERIKKRNQLINIYKERLKNSSFKLLEQENGFCSYYKCILLTDINNDYLFEFCKQHNISLTGKVYDIPVHKQPAFEYLNLNDFNELINTEFLAKNHICPPLYPELTFDEVNYICDILLKAEYNFINNKNKYAMLTSINNINLFYEDIPSITDKQNQVLIKITACGICGSDYHYYRNGGLGTFKIKLPFYIGHEPTGIIKDSYISNLKINSRVIIEPSYFCNSCKYCKSNHENVCEKSTFLGSLTEKGAFAQYLLIHPTQIFLIPNNISDQISILIEPLCVAYRVIKNITKLNITDKILIFGAGPIGLCILFLLKQLKFENITICDILQYRVEFSNRFNPNNAYNLDELKLKNNKYDVCIDAVGSNEVFQLCQLYVDLLGKIIIVGIPEKEDLIDYNPHKLRIKEASVFNVRRGTGVIEDVIELITHTDINDLNILETIITNKYKFNDIDIAFKNSSNYIDKSIKSIICFEN